MKHIAPFENSRIFGVESIKTEMLSVYWESRGNRVATDRSLLKAVKGKGETTSTDAITPSQSTRLGYEMQSEWYTDIDRLSKNECPFPTTAPGRNSSLNPLWHPHSSPKFHGLCLYTMPCTSNNLWRVLSVCLATVHSSTNSLPACLWIYH